LRSNLENPFVVVMEEAAITRSGIAAAVAIAAATVALALSSADGAIPPSLASCGAPINAKVEPERFRGFPLYALGCRWRWYRLYEVSLGPGRYIPEKPMSFQAIYGESAEGQAFPVAVQVWPACFRTRSSYPRRFRRQDTTIRGVPASWFEARGRLELYTGRVTIVLYRSRGVTARQLRTAAEDLMGVNNPLKAYQPLPKPASGALEGKLKCRRGETG
jgi:hypothetical protein